MEAEQKAYIYQINASQGGVPKRPLPHAEVTVLGLTNDRQKNTRFHGGPTRALCLFSLERIQALQAEGHPITPGSIGENVTIAGLDWAQLIPGVRLRLGDEVEIEVTAYAVPCKQIQASFLEEAFGRVSPKTHPGWARVYARVLRTGCLQVGDRVTLR